MTTASDVISAALGLTLTRSADIPLEPDELQQAIFQLNTMLASWNLELGYSDVSSPSDTVTTPPYSINAIVQNLGVQLAPAFGGIVDADLRENARQAKKDLLKIVVKIGPAKMPSTLPRGSGNTQSWQGNRTFYDPPEPIAAPTDGLLLLADNATETAITTLLTPVLVSGMWAVQSTHQMDGTAAGRLTYTPAVPAIVNVTVKATIRMASSGNKVVTAFLAKNGVVVAANGSGTASDSASVEITIPWEIELSKDDYLEVWVSNASDTVNLLVSDAELRIN